MSSPPLRFASDAPRAAELLQAGMLAFLEWFLQEKAGRNPVRWKLLLWDMCASPCPEHEGWPDADWPAWRLYRHARERVGHFEDITRRAALRGFTSEGNVHTALSRTFRPSFRQWTAGNDVWQALALYLDSHFVGHVVEHGESLAGRWQPFRNLLEPAEDWAKTIAGRLQAALTKGGGLILALAHYPSDYGQFLPAVALDVRQALAGLCPGFQVRVVPSEVEDLAPYVRRSNPPPGSLLIVPAAGAAWYLDLEDGLREAAARRCHLLAFCPDARTAGRIQEMPMLGYSSFPVHLSPWYSPETPAPGDTGVPDWAEQIARRNRLLQVLAAFSTLHRRARLEWLAAITGLDEHAIRRYVIEETAGQVEFNPATGQAYWSTEQGSETFLARFFDTTEKQRDLYVEIIGRLNSQKPPEWARAALNLLRSMHQTGRLRLLRAVLLELEERAILPHGLLDAFAGSERLQARLDLAKVCAEACLFEKAHDLLLAAEVAGDDPRRFDDFWTHQTLVAGILTRQVADTGRTCFFEAAGFIYSDLRRRVLTDRSRTQQLDERLAQLYLQAGRAQEALDLLDRYGPELTPFGNSLKARALAELGRFDEARAVPTIGGPRGIELDRLSNEDQTTYEERWNRHVENLLGQPAGEVPVEALHQAAVRALERGHFAAARRLIEHARSHYRDNVHLAVAWARLLLETGRAGEAVACLWELEKSLIGRDNLVVAGALYDALIELWGLEGAGMKREWQERLRQLPQPVFDPDFRREHYLPAQYARLVTLNAKAWWRGVLGDTDPLQTNRVIAALESLATPPALNLAARILAAAGHHADALAKLEAALAVAADPQTSIRTLNTLARILLDRVAGGDPSACERAGQALDESERRDAGNTYTMLLRAEWLERCGYARQAAGLRQRAAGLRQTDR